MLTGAILGEPRELFWRTVLHIVQDHLQNPPNEPAKFVSQKSFLSVFIRIHTVATISVTPGQKKLSS